VGNITSRVGLDIFGPGNWAFGTNTKSQSYDWCFKWKLGYNNTNLEGLICHLVFVVQKVLDKKWIMN